MSTKTNRMNNYHRPVRSSKRSSSSCSSSRGDSPRSDFIKRRHKDRRRSRSPSNSYNSKMYSDVDGKHREKHGSSRDNGEKHSSMLNPISAEGSGYGDDFGNAPAGSSSDQKSNPPAKCDRSYQPAKQHRSGKKNSRHPQGKNGKAKKLPWVPPPLPEHLRPVPQVTKVVFPARSSFCPLLQNQFQNDGSFLEVFRQRMEAAHASKQSEEMSLRSMENNLATPVNEPVVTKRRMTKPLKTGMVQKPKKRVDACDPEAKDKDSWSLYMKEVQKYRANKCINSEACRPLMK